MRIVVATRVQRSRMMRTMNVSKSNPSSGPVNGTLSHHRDGADAVQGQSG